MLLPTNVAPELKLFTDETRAALRALTEANLPHLCSVQRLTTGARIGGAAVTTPVTLFTNVPCRLAAVKRRTQEALEGDQPFQPDQWALVFRVGVVIPEGAVATVTGIDALGAFWSRVVRVGTPTHDRAFEIQSRYSARDVFDGKPLPVIGAGWIIGGGWVL